MPGGSDSNWTCAVYIADHERLFPLGCLPKFHTKKEAQRFAAGEAVKWLKEKGLFLEERPVRDTSMDLDVIGGAEVKDEEDSGMSNEDGVNTSSDSDKFVIKLPMRPRSLSVD